MDLRWDGCQGFLVLCPSWTWWDHGAVRAAGLSDFSLWQCLTSNPEVSSWLTENLCCDKLGAAWGSWCTVRNVFHELLKPSGCFYINAIYICEVNVLESSMYPINPCKSSSSCMVYWDHHIPAVLCQHPSLPDASWWLWEHLMFLLCLI